MEPPPPSDVDLIARAVRGDERAFQSLWTSQRDPVYKFAYWMLGDRPAAEDVTQECFLALLEHPSRFEPSRATLRTFLLSIARNNCRKHWRRSSSEVDIDGDDPDTAPLAEDVLVDAEEAEILSDAVALLPPLQREALYLFEYEELSLEQSAAIAQVSVGTMKSRLHRGRQRLKRELSWLARK